MVSLKNNLASIAALIAAVVAIGGGFAKFGEMQTKLDALSNAEGVDLSGIQKTVQWYLDCEEWVQRVTRGEYRNWVETQYA